MIRLSYSLVFAISFFNLFVEMEGIIKNATRVNYLKKYS
jgi:hypothetical protein